MEELTEFDFSCQLSANMMNDLQCPNIGILHKSITVYIVSNKQKTVVFFLPLCRSSYLGVDIYININLYIQALELGTSRTFFARLHSKSFTLICLDSK